MPEFLSRIWKDSWGIDFFHFDKTRILVESYLTYISDAKELVLAMASRYTRKEISDFYILQKYIIWATVCPHLIDGFTVLPYLLRDENQINFLKSILPRESRDWDEVITFKLRKLLKKLEWVFPWTVLSPRLYAFSLPEVFEKTLNAIETENDGVLELAYFIGIIRAKEPWYKPECLNATRKILFYGLVKRKYEKFLSELISSYMQRGKPKYVGLLIKWGSVEMSLRAEIFLGSQK
jgi:hypothetical protein